MLIQRLKDKVGNRSNASSEIEFDGTLARRIGEAELEHHLRNVLPLVREAVTGRSALPELQAQPHERRKAEQVRGLGRHRLLQVLGGIPMAALAHAAAGQPGAQSHLGCCKCKNGDAPNRRSVPGGIA